MTPPPRLSRWPDIPGPGAISTPAPGGTNWGQRFIDTDGTADVFTIAGIEHDLSANPAVGRVSTIKTNR